MLKNYDEKQAEALVRPLQRFLQYGHIPLSAFKIALEVSAGARHGQGGK